MENEDHTKENKNAHGMSLGLCVLALFVLVILAGYCYVHYPYNKEVPQEETAVTVSLHLQTRDSAVEAYLRAAQVIAETYYFTNGNSYSGLCEHSEALYSLEGGILKYIKMVGATEVYCSTEDAQYLIEAKKPDNKAFYCIDETGEEIEQPFSRKGFTDCKD